MKEIFIVKSDTGVIMAAFSDKETALLCKKYFEKRLLDSVFSVELEFLDLFTSEDYE